jgi:MFS family permease
VLAWFAWTGGQNIWPLVALSFIHGASRTSSTPVEQAMLGSLVPERDLLNAVSLLQANLNGARLLGPLLAAPFLNVGGGAGAFLVVAALITLVFLHCAFTMGYDAALPRRASDVLGASGTAYSLLVMAIGGGSLVGAAFLLAGFARRVHCGTYRRVRATPARRRAARHHVVARAPRTGDAKDP